MSPSKRNTRLQKMNEEREQSFRPRLWGNGGKPISKEGLAMAIAAADADDKFLEDIPGGEEEVSPEDVPPGTRVLTEEEEKAWLESNPPVSFEDLKKQEESIGDRMVLERTTNASE